MISSVRALVLALLVSITCTIGSGQNAIIIVIDGARHQETFGAEGTYIPHMWNELRPLGTIFTNFRNDGRTVTCPGHATILTGRWQDLENNGSERPTSATLFEYYRKQTGSPERSCFVIAGKKKLEMLTYGTDTAYGAPFGASFVSRNEKNDVETYQNLRNVLRNDHPSLVIVNFAQTDVKAHDSDWNGYRSAIRGADSLIADLWNYLQSDSIYRNTTDLYVTNDHGRHDDQHGGFKDHGDNCEGCRHIMLLAVGPRFPKGVTIDRRTSQVDIAPTIGAMKSLHLPKLDGYNLLPMEK
jgi:arylsulfatase A-like enzyme